MGIRKSMLYVTQNLKQDTYDMTTNKLYGQLLEKPTWAIYLTLPSDQNLGQLLKTMWFNGITHIHIYGQLLKISHCQKIILEYLLRTVMWFNGITHAHIYGQLLKILHCQEINLEYLLRTIVWFNGITHVHSYGQLLKRSWLLHTQRPVKNKGHYLGQHHSKSKAESDSLFKTVILCCKRIPGKMKLNEPVCYKLERLNSWQQAKHAKLYYDLLTAQQREPLQQLLFLNRRDLQFCIYSTLP